LPVYTNLEFDYSDLCLGQAVREQRKRRGWTLQELASRVSISAANLSAIENEKVVLDIERLFAIAEALEIRLDVLLPRNPSRHFQISRGTAFESTAAQVDGWEDYHNRPHPLAGEFAGKHIEPFHFEIRPVPDDQLKFVSHHHEEFFFVQRGEVEFLAKTPDGLVRERLQMGDCAYFRSNLPHCIRCSTSGQVAHAIHVIHSPYQTSDSANGNLTFSSKEDVRETVAARAGEQFAALRRSHGLSMAEFAPMLKLSVRMLADIERGRKAIPIDLLLLAGRRFHKPIEYFLSHTIVERPFYFVQRAGDIKRLPVRARRRLVDSGWAETEFRSLASDFGPRGMYPYYVKLRPPGNETLSLHEHHGQEFVYVLNGEVTLITVLGGKRVTETLVAGDACFIESAVPHRFVGMGLSPYGESIAEVIDVYWCPLGESYLFDDDPLAAPANRPAASQNEEPCIPEHRGLP